MKNLFNHYRVIPKLNTSKVKILSSVIEWPLIHYLDKQLHFNN